MGVALNRLEGVNELLPQAENILKTTMNVEQAKIYLVFSEQNEMIRFTDNKTVEFHPISSGIAGHVASGSTLNNIPNAYNHPLYNGKIDIDTAMPMICMPIKNISTGEILAVFEVLNAKGIQGLSSTLKARINPLDYETLEFFSQQFSQVIQNNMIWHAAKGENLFEEFKTWEQNRKESEV
jgi:hypothetical protein